MISPVGEITLKVERKGNRRGLRFQVVNSNNKPLLSAETCEELELLKVELDPEESIHSVENSLLTRDPILRDYTDVFEGLGHIGDTKIVTDHGIKPVQYSPRRVLVALRERVEAKLDSVWALQVFKTTLRYQPSS